MGNEVSSLNPLSPIADIATTGEQEVGQTLRTGIVQAGLTVRAGEQEVGKTTRAAAKQIGGIIQTGEKEIGKTTREGIRETAAVVVRGEEVVETGIKETADVLETGAKAVESGVEDISNVAMTGITEVNETIRQGISTARVFGIIALGGIALFFLNNGEQILNKSEKLVGEVLDQTQPLIEAGVAKGKAAIDLA